MKLDHGKLDNGWSLKRKELLEIIKSDPELLTNPTWDYFVLIRYPCLSIRRWWGGYPAWVYSFIIHNDLLDLAEEEFVSLTFLQVLEMVPPDVAQKLLFHLDILDF